MFVVIYFFNFLENLQSVILQIFWNWENINNIYYVYVNGPNISDARKDSDNITRTDKIGGFLSVSRPDIINLRINLERKFHMFWSARVLCFSIEPRYKRYFLD